MGSHVWTYWLIHLYWGSLLGVVPGSVLGTAGQLHSFPDYHLTRLRRLGEVSATVPGFQYCCVADGRAQIANRVFSKMYGSSYVRTLPSLLLAQQQKAVCMQNKVHCLPAVGKKGTSLASMQYGSSSATGTMWLLAMANLWPAPRNI